MDVRKLMLVRYFILPKDDSTVRIKDSPRTIDVVPGVAHQRDLAEDGGVDTQVRCLVTVDVASMENLALSVDIGVESGLAVLTASTVGVRNSIVGGIGGVSRSQQRLDFSGSQSRLDQIKDVSSGILVALLGSSEPDEGKDNKELHG